MNPVQSNKKRFFLLDCKALRPSSTALLTIPFQPVGLSVGCQHCVLFSSLLLLFLLYFLSFYILFVSFYFVKPSPKTPMINFQTKIFIKLPNFYDNFKMRIGRCQKGLALTFTKRKRRFAPVSRIAVEVIFYYRTETDF